VIIECKVAHGAIQRVMGSRTIEEIIVIYTCKYLRGRCGISESV
jgi:hypothetical protein